MQTVVLVMPESDRGGDSVEVLARVGLSRIVRPGTMNIYEIPWDGMRSMDRMVRWVSCNQ